MDKFVIATHMVPTDVAEFEAECIACAALMGVRILGMRGLRSTRGCYNIALKLKGERSEEFVRELTLALMPARYACTDGEVRGFSWSGLK